MGLPQDGALIGAGDHAGIPAQPAGGDIGCGLDIGGPSGGQLLVGHQQLDGGVGDVDGDLVSLLHQTDGTAGGGLRTDMADGSAPAGAGEAAVSDEGHSLIQTHACQSGGRIQHLPHAGAALGALVADDHHIAGDDLPGVDGGDGIVLTVEHPGRTGVGLHLGGHGAALDHAAVGGQIAPEDLQTAGGAVGVFNGTDGVGVQILGAPDVLPYCLTGDGQAVQIQQVPLGQLCLYGRDAAGGVQLRHVGGARRGQMAQVGSPGGDLVEQLQVHRYASLLGDGQQVQHRVGGAAQGHVTGQGVADAALVDDVPGADVLSDQLHNGGACPAAQLEPLAVGGGNGAVARQADADGLAQAVHAVGGIHAGAAAAAGTAVLGTLLQLFLGDHPGLVGAHGLKHFGEADLLAIIGASQHGAAGADHGGHVHPHGGHDHTGNDLVAVGHQHHAVELVGHEHGLHAVADQLPAGQGVLHAHMAHGDAVAHADSGDHEGRAACCLNASFHGVGELVQVHVAGDDVAVGADYGDERLFQILGRAAQGIEQAAVRRPFGALCHIIAAHCVFLFFLIFSWDLKNRRLGSHGPRPPARLWCGRRLTSSASSSSGAARHPPSRWGGQRPCGA